jgi:Fe-Mn family superoxide dismutase
MKPGGGGAPPQPLADALAASFGSLDKFKSEFKDAAVAQFGSGWAWLVQEGDSLKARARRRLADCGMPADARRRAFVAQIVKTSNAVTPIVHGQTPLMTCDVWEHAYCACSRMRADNQTACGCKKQAMGC